MAGNSVAKIAVATPMATGGVMVAPVGTSLPVGVSAATTGFTALGYAADDGLRPAGERTSASILDWAGDEIYSPQESHSVKFQLKLYAALDGDTLVEVFGDDNVTTVGSLTTVTETGSPLPVHPWLFDMRDNDKRVRIVVPNGQITACTEGPYVRNALLSFDVTISCYKDDSGKKTYRYIDDGTAAAAPTISGRAPSGNLATAGGDILYVTGTNFVGTTAATIGGTNVADFYVVDDQHLIVTTPAKSAGSYNLVVTNATGASSGFSLTFA